MNRPHIRLLTLHGLSQLKWSEVQRQLTQDEITYMLQTAGNWWKHSGDVKKPHAMLPGGCTNGYINVFQALTYTNLCEIFAHDLFLRLQDQLNGHKPAWVIGIAHSGVPLAQKVAELFGCRFDYTHKTGDDGQKYDRIKIAPDEPVLLVDEIMARGTSMLNSKHAIEAYHQYPIRWLPMVGVFVYRSAIPNIEGLEIVSSANYDIQSWSRHECPLCQQGSLRIHPKEGNNWALLTQ